MKRHVIALGLAVVAAVGGATFVAAVSPAAFETIDQQALLSDSKTSITVTGTTLCFVGDTANVTAIVTQSSGNVDVTGQGSSGDFECTGTVQNWSAVVNVVTAPAYKKGPATAFSNVNTTDGVDSDQSQIITVGLRIK